MRYGILIVVEPLSLTAHFLSSFFISSFSLLETTLTSICSLWFDLPNYLAHDGGVRIISA